MPQPGDRAENKLWFDVEKRFKTILREKRVMADSCGLM